AAPAININSATNAKGELQFRVPTSKDTQNSRQKLQVQLQYGAPKKQEKVTVERELEVIPSNLQVDFYPEGGSLIAGAPNQVYYRVRTPLGETVAPEGPVTLLAGDKVVFESAREQPAGVFSFVPDPKARYRVRIGSPMRQEIANPLAGLSI